MKLAIIDTGVLRNLYYLNLIENLRLFYVTVRVPRAVEAEFFQISDEIEKSRRFSFLLPFYEQNTSWFQRCNNYEESLIQIFLADRAPATRKLDRGEAEVFVQNQVHGNNHELLFDERIAVRFAANLSVQTTGTLTLLARLEIQLAACHYFDCACRLRDQYGFHVTDAVIQHVFASTKRKCSNGY